MSKEGQRVKVSDQIMFLMSWVRVIQVTVSDICSEQSSNRKCKEWNQSKTVSSVLLVLTRRRFYWHWQHQWWEGTVAVMGAGEDHLQLQGDGVVAPALSMLGCGTLISLKRMQSVITVVMGREVGRLRRTIRTVVRMRDQCGGGWRLPRLSRGVRDVEGAGGGHRPGHGRLTQHWHQLYTNQRSKYSSKWLMNNVQSPWGQWAVVHSAGPKKVMGGRAGGDLGQAGIEGMCDDVRIGKNNTQYNTMC